jgi:uncharacterized Ntn-hydrolase superfamily protein
MGLHSKPEPYVGTFSIAAFDRNTGDVGVAVASKFLAVGNIVPWAEPGVGAVATQALVSAHYGQKGLQLMKSGMTAAHALKQLLSDDPDADRRQVGLVGVDGTVAAHTGSGCSSWAGHKLGENFTCQGNILAGPWVLEAMADAFGATPGSLVHRLYSALTASDQAGGDRRGRQAAALYVLRSGGGYQGLSDVVADLRVDDAPNPVTELGRLLKLHDLHFGSTPKAERLSLREPSVISVIISAMSRAGAASTSTNVDDPTVLQAIDKFLGCENLEERVQLETLTIDPPALEYLRSRYGS